MSELGRIAILKSHMVDLKTRVFELMNQMEDNQIETTATIESLRQELWQSEAALGDAERELKFVKTTAVKAIRRLATVMHEREQLVHQVQVLEREKQQLLEINMYNSQETPGPQETPQFPLDVCDATWTVVESRT